MSAGVSDWVWRDTTCFERRHAKSVAALEAVARGLARERPALARETGFLELHAGFSRLAADVAEPVRRDPQAYFFARVAYELLDCELRARPLPPLARAVARDHGAADAGEALALHLGDFGRFAAGAALRAGHDLGFDTALRIPLPVALPGTRLQVSGTGAGWLRGTRDGTAWITADSPDAEECPSLPAGAGEVCLRPATFHMPGLDVGPVAGTTSVAFQRRHAPLLARALGRLERFHPETWQQLGGLIRVLALKPREAGSLRNNLSHSDLPGAILISRVEQPWFLADVLIHEFHHNRLFCLEEDTPLFEGDDGDLARASRYVTVHQPVPRPLHGIFHALYVSLPVSHYWLRVLASREADADTRALALDRALRGVLCARVCAFQIRSHAKLSAFGSRLFARLERDLDALAAACRQAELPDDAPAVDCGEDGGVRPQPMPDGGPGDSVRASLRAHLEAVRAGAASAAVDAQVRELRESVVDTAM